MSQVNAGAASIDLKVRAEQAEAELKKVQAELDKLKAKGKEGPDALNKGVADATQSVGRLKAALIGLPAAAFGFFTLGQKIRDFFNIDRMALLEVQRFLTNLDFSRPEESLDRVNERLKQLQEIAGAANESIAKSFRLFVSGDLDDLGPRIKALEDERDSLRAVADRRQSEREKQAAKEKFEEQKKLYDASVKLNDERIQREQDARDEEMTRAVQDEEDHKKYLADLAEKEHQDELRRIDELHRRRMDLMREEFEERRRLMEQQEAGFGLVNVPGGASGGAALRGSILARFGRGSGGRQ